MANRFTTSVTIGTTSCISLQWHFMSLATQFQLQLHAKKIYTIHNHGGLSSEESELTIDHCTYTEPLLTDLTPEAFVVDIIMACTKEVPRQHLLCVVTQWVVYYHQQHNTTSIMSALLASRCDPTQARAALFEFSARREEPATLQLSQMRDVAFFELSLSLWLA